MANSSKTVRLISATMAISVAGVSKIGFVRTMAIAAIFGNAEVDAFVVAQNMRGFYLV